MVPLYILTVLAMLATMEVGYRITKARQRKSSDKTDAGVGAMSGASLALVAFLLAFVVSLGSGIATERRQLVMAEANAIGEIVSHDSQSGNLQSLEGWLSRRQHRTGVGTA
jgi:hypothetical protein